MAEPGIYKFWDLSHRMTHLCVPKFPRMVQVTNQEVLTKDNIAFRCSFLAEYRFCDPELVAQNVDFSTVRSYGRHYALDQFDGRVSAVLQEHYRQALAAVTAEEANASQGAVLSSIPDAVIERLLPLGIALDRQAIGYVNFPKSIQDLFAKQLEAQIRSKTDLENARSTVAAARALKNAADLMKDDKNMKLLRYLETIEKIAEKGKHTFVLGGTGFTPVGGSG